MSNPSKAPSSWKPYVIGFALGAVVLTAIPFLQKGFLRAPPPVRQLNPWRLESLGGGDTSSASLMGKVVLATIENAPCDSACLTRQAGFGTAVRHVDDLHGSVVLLTVVGTDAEAGLKSLIESANSAWRFARSDQAMTTDLQQGLEVFLGSNGTQFDRSQAIVLIDQNNAVRGYWRGDGEGRGNSINAARLLARRGPTP